MTLPSSGAIKMSQINSELGRSSNAQISLDTAENGGYKTLNSGCSTPPSSGNPASMSEWYSYNQCCAVYSSVFYWYSDGGANAQSDCGGGAYSSGVIPYQDNGASMGSGARLYSNSSCTSLYASICFTDFSQYYCTNSSGEVNTNGFCTT
jgi:hypothetical protein